MTTQLPPQRALPDADQMLADILAGDSERAATNRRRQRRHRTVISGLLVAATAAAVTAVAVPAAMHRTGDPIAASPAPARPSPSTPTSTPKPTPGLHPLGTAVAFENFTVTVSHVSHHPMFGILIHATVCVRSLPPNPTGTTTRVSWDPWTVATGENRTPATLRKAPIAPPSNLFPRERYVKVGQCVSGWIPFNADEHADVAAVLYTNSLGNTAAWAGQ